jgi:hypothetical protein
MTHEGESENERNAMKKVAYIYALSAWVGFQLEQSTEYTIAFSGKAGHAFKSETALLSIECFLKNGVCAFSVQSQCRVSV